METVPVCIQLSDTKKAGIHPLFKSYPLIASTITLYCRVTSP